MEIIFTLPGINTKEVEKKFNISLISNIDSIDEIGDMDDSANVTKLTELETESISFQDQSKKIHTCRISMIDYSSCKSTKEIRYNCFWCRYSFEGEPIGCPIEYVPNTAIKKYFSEISRDNYVIKEHITSNKNILDSLVLKKKNYYISDGVFCSFNCALAFAKDNKHKKMYDNSIILLNKIMKKITDNLKFEIDPAPHWRLLKDYGGYMSIDEFRNSFNKSYFHPHGIIKTVPKFKSVGWLYEKKLKF